MFDGVEKRKCNFECEDGSEYIWLIVVLNCKFSIQRFSIDDLDIRIRLLFGFQSDLIAVFCCWMSFDEGGLIILKNWWCEMWLGCCLALAWVSLCFGIIDLHLRVWIVRLRFGVPFDHVSAIKTLVVHWVCQSYLLFRLWS